MSRALRGQARLPEQAIETADPYREPDCRRGEAGPSLPRRGPLTALAWLLALPLFAATVSPETPRPPRPHAAPASSRPRRSPLETPPAATTLTGARGLRAPGRRPRNAPRRHDVTGAREPRAPGRRPAEPRRSRGADREDGTIRDTVSWPHYDKGFVLVPTLDPVKVPFRLVFNQCSQFRYTNTLLVESTYTDHFGQVHEVIKRERHPADARRLLLLRLRFNPRLDFNILPIHVERDALGHRRRYVGFVFDSAFAFARGTSLCPRCAA